MNGAWQLKQLGVWASALASATILWTSPAWAADPFRTGADARPIGPNTQAAFEIVFKQGNYQIASQRLDQALALEPNEPMIYSMKAALAYINGDLPAFARFGTLTREVGQRLTATDPLRGHLYTGVGYFMEGGYVVASQGLVSGTPQALPKIQQMFSEIEEAQKLNASDPELNLIKGYMDLMIATNLPFSSIDDAISRLQRSAPEYLSWRGIAIGYRDSNKLDQALEAVNRALLQAPDNPELHYLKAQILVKRDQFRDSIASFQRALALREQLPPRLVRTIEREARKAQEKIDRQPAVTPPATPAS